MSRIATALLLSLVATVANSQDGKPTKEQTIDYIQSNYPNRLAYGAGDSSESAKSIYRGKITDLAVRIEGSKVTFTWLDVLEGTLFAMGAMSTSEFTHDQVEVSFDLKNIETIDGTNDYQVGYLAYDEADHGSYPMNLVFFAAGNKPLITETRNGTSNQVAQVRVPLTIDAVGDNHKILQEFKDWQIYKAFQHLRKLSGAPEPLRF